MPYITTEQVKEIRETLKKEFPAFKFSVTRENHSGVRVAIMSAPFNMLIDTTKNYQSINHYCIKETYKNAPEIMKALLGVYQIVSKGNYTVTEDSDYGNVPSFYVWLTVGQWDKPFQVINNGKTQPAKVDFRMSDTSAMPQTNF